MKIAFFSNFLNHHQLPLCLALLNNSDIEFKFVACEETHENRLKMNYADMNNQYPFVVRAYEDEEEAMKIALTYDVAIIGSAHLEYLDARMKNNLLTFRFCERSLKKGTWRRFIPHTRKKIYDEYIRYKDKPLYILGASAYVSSDLALCGFDKDKCFCWGYFPEIHNKNLDDVFCLKRKNKAPEILYAGRLLKLKHVMDAVRAVHNLIRRGIKVHFTIIGEGETEKTIKRYIRNNRLEGYIEILPFVSPQEVREYMDRADIYFFGSDFYEGWGAVVNEAMNSACAMLVSHAVGSSPYLINSGENGYIYEFANIEDLTQKLFALVSNADLREKFGKEAYKTVTDVWTADNAAKRLYNVCQTIAVNGDCKSMFDSGPCSVAKIYKNNWFES